MKNKKPIFLFMLCATLILGIASYINADPCIYENYDGCVPLTTCAYYDGGFIRIISTPAVWDTCELIGPAYYLCSYDWDYEQWCANFASWNTYEQCDSVSSIGVTLKYAMWPEIDWDDSVYCWPMM